jgi:ankyrin repeat protein
MAEETKSEAARLTQHLAAETDKQAWEEAKNQGLKGVHFYLAHHGFDVEKEANYKRNALFFAASHGFLEVVIHLIEKLKLNPNKPDSSGYTPLLDAAEGGHLPVIKYLVKKYGSVVLRVWTSCHDDNGNAAHLAARNGHSKVVEYLFENHDFNPEATNNNRHTPLLLAAENGHLGIAKYLINKYGPRLLKQGAHGHWDYKAMHLAATAGHLEMVRYLSLFPFDYTARAEGQRALGFAIEKGHVEITKLLIKMGSDPAQAEDGWRYYREQKEQTLKHKKAGTEPHPSDRDLLRFYLQFNKEVDDFFTPAHLQSLRREYQERQVLLALVTRDELPPPDDDLATIIAGYAAAPVEGAGFSDFTAFVQSKMTHLPYGILNPLLALLNKEQVTDSIHAARFLGKVILNRPELISLDELKKEIKCLTTEWSHKKSRFLDALTAIDENLKKIIQKAAEARKCLDQGMLHEQKPTPSKHATPHHPYQA